MREVALWPHFRFKVRLKKKKKKKITCIELITGNYGLCHNESQERINPLILLLSKNKKLHIYPLS